MPYTISGVNSNDINGAALTGNFVIINNSATVDFLITTTSNQTKTITVNSNGFTQTISIIENRFGLFLLLSDNNQNFTSIQYPQILDLSDPADITNITILQPDDLRNNTMQSEDSVLVGNKVFYSTDFVSITNFNVPDPVPLTFPEKWAG